MRPLPAGYILSDTVDVAAAHAYLARSYWSPGIAAVTVAKAIANSWCVAVRFGGEQVGMARCITDRATFAWLADVYVLEDHRGRGLAKAMIAHFQDHADMQALRRWGLVTVDAHALYRELGWNDPAHPERYMERYFPEAGR